MQAIEDHSAYSTHYCTQEQLSDDEEDDTVSVAELQDTVKVFICFLDLSGVWYCCSLQEKY